MTPLQKQMIHKWNNHTRFCYNKTISYLNDVNPMDVNKNYKYKDTFNIFNEIDEYKTTYDDLIKFKSIKIKQVLIDTFNNYHKIPIVYVKEIFDVIFLLSRTYYEAFLKVFEKKDYNLPFDQLLILLKDDFIKYLIKQKSLLEIQKIIQDYLKYEKDNKLKFKYINWYEKISPEYISNYYGNYDLRNDIIPKAINLYYNTEWLLETPKAIREGGVFEAKQAFDTSLKNFWNGHTRKPTMGYRKKKTQKWSIVLPKTCITVSSNKKVDLYKNGGKSCEVPFVFGDSLSLNEDVMDGIDNNTMHPYQDCRLIYDGYNYYLGIPIKKDVKNDNTRYWNITSDPGVRTFHTTFSSDHNEYMEIGKNASNKIFKKMLYLDKLISKLNKHEYTNNKSRKRLEIVIKKQRRKIMNLQEELHNKTSLFLCKNYKTITIPKLNKNNDMIKTKNRKLKTVTVRKMVVLGHNKFIQTLKNKAKEYNSCVEIVTEEYSSQKCSNCKKCTRTGLKQYKCKFCKYTIDRDVQASKNINISSMLNKFFDEQLKYY